MEEGQTVFAVNWHTLPSPAFERQFLTYWWRSRGTWSPTLWSIGFAIVVDGRPIGIQDLMSRDFAVCKTVHTGSWLGREFQGRGYGTEMRAAVLALAFDGLGAEVAESGYFEGNDASARVSEKLGYEPNGLQVWNVAGQRAIERKLRVTRDGWKRDLVPVTIEGLEPCLPLFGVGDLGPNDWPKF